MCWMDRSEFDEAEVFQMPLLKHHEEGTIREEIKYQRLGSSRGRIMTCHHVITSELCYLFIFQGALKMVQNGWVQGRRTYCRGIVPECG